MERQNNKHLYMLFCVLCIVLCITSPQTNFGDFWFLNFNPPAPPAFSAGHISPNASVLERIAFGGKCRTLQCIAVPCLAVTWVLAKTDDHHRNPNSNDRDHLVRVKILAVWDYFSPQTHSSWPARAGSAVIDPAIRDYFALNGLDTDMSAL